MILSICICTLESRKLMLDVLVAHIQQQIYQSGPDQVEILIEPDQGEMTTGAKSNLLYNRAVGKYVCRVDDDDWVAPYYIYEILKAATMDTDAIAMNGVYTKDGREHATWDISMYNPYITTKRNGRTHFLRFHNHLSPIKKEIAIQFPFPDQKMYEDYVFAESMHRAQAIKSETRIARPMYEYRYRSNKQPNT